MKIYFAMLYLNMRHIVLVKHTYSVPTLTLFWGERCWYGVVFGYALLVLLCCFRNRWRCSSQLNILQNKKKTKNMLVKLASSHILLQKWWYFLTPPEAFKNIHVMCAWKIFLVYFLAWLKNSIQTHKHDIEITSLEIAFPLRMLTCSCVCKMWNPVFNLWLQVGRIISDWVKITSQDLR